MEERKNKPLYILIAIAILFFIIYFALTFLTIFKIENIELNVYKAAIGSDVFKASPIMLVAIILGAIGLLLLITMLILIPFKKKRQTYILLDALALPFLTFNLLVNIFISPIFKLSNSDINKQIDVMHYILIPQNICLFIAILLNIAIIFYLSISGYKRYNYERRKGVK